MQFSFVFYYLRLGSQTIRALSDGQNWIRFYNDLKMFSRLKKSSLCLGLGYTHPKSQIRLTPGFSVSWRLIVHDPIIKTPLPFLSLLLQSVNWICAISDSEVTTQGRNAAASVSSEDVWDSVKFSFEIEEVSAAVFWKESAKVNNTIAQSSRNWKCISENKTLFRLLWFCGCLYYRYTVNYWYQN